MSTALQEDIDAVDSAYEFLLAYAAQGREDDVGGPAPRARDILTELDDAFGNIVARLSEPDAGPTDERRQFNALATMRRKLETWAASADPLPTYFVDGEQNEVIDRLKALGYLGGEE